MTLMDANVAVGCVLALGALASMYIAWVEERSDRARIRDAVYETKTLGAVEGGSGPLLRDGGSTGRNPAVQGKKKGTKMKSWRTTLCGICLILGTIGNAGYALLDNDPTTNIDFKASAAALVTGMALLAARDNKVTSEEAGAK